MDPARPGRGVWLVLGALLLVAAAAAAVAQASSGSSRAAMPPPGPALAVAPVSPMPPRTAMPKPGPASAPPPGDDDARLEWLRAVATGATASPSSAGATAATPDRAPPAPVPAPISWQEASRSVRIVVYTTSWCPHCRRAKAWLAANGISYEERNIESSAQYARENRSLNPRGSIPTFDVDGDVSVGFSQQELVAMIQRAARRSQEQN
ncbi:MAG: glutaredoxin family protein [Polyangiaceae bacterium]